MSTIPKSKAYSVLSQMTAKALLHITASLTRKLPNFHGNGRLCEAVNKFYVSKCTNDTVLVAPMKNGTKIIVDLRSGSEFRAFYCGNYDQELLDVANHFLGVDPVIFDIGGNIGFWTIAFGKIITMRGGSGHVYTFEPLRGNYDRICENVNLNKLSNFCTVTNIGLSDSKGKTEITLSGDYLLGSATGNAAILKNKNLDIGLPRVEIILDTLDGYVQTNKIDKIDFIKIDIEGHEDFFLRGAKQSISTYRPTMLMEVNKPYYKTRAANLDDLFFPLIPEDYNIYRAVRSQLIKINTFSQCKYMDNVLLVPNELLGNIKKLPVN